VSDLWVAYANTRAEAPLGEPAWLTQRRAEGAAAFAGLPTTREEAWRFTSLSELARFAIGTGTGTGDIAAVVHNATAALGECHRVVFVDGAFSAEHSSLGGLPSGVAIGPLTRAIERHPDRVRALLGRALDDKERALTALNSAAFSDGLFVEIRAGQTLSAPIHAVFACSDGSASFPRNLIRVGAGARAVVVEHYVGMGTAMCCPASELVLEPDAQLDHTVLQEQPITSWQLAAVGALQETGSRLVQHSLALGGRVARVDLLTRLAGERSHAQLDGLYLGAGRQLLDHHTTVDHAVPETTSDEHYKGILGGRAHGVFHGRVHVRPGAIQIDARQANRNLLLSDGARINTKPQLEIYADDVRCSHGATVGRLDDDQLFYLRARGIDAEAARAMLTLAFANEIGARLPVPELAAHLTYQIRRWLAASLKDA